MAAKKGTKTRQGASVYQLKVTLLESSPPIWRRLRVPGSVTLDRLHYVLQAAMGWDDSHMHLFIVGDEEYADRQFGLDDARDERKATLSRIAPRAGAAFGYTYDFGDDWEHEIVVEKILPAGQETEHPVCVEGERACPPEDCGGVWGYEEFLEAIRDPEHEEHEDMLDWVGGSFDPETFDIKEANKLLRRIE